MLGGRVDAATLLAAGATANTMEGNSRASKESVCGVHIPTGQIQVGRGDTSNIYEQALVSLKIQETVNAGVGWTKAILIEGG